MVKNVVLETPLSNPPVIQTEEISKPKRQPPKLTQEQRLKGAKAGAEAKKMIAKVKAFERETAKQQMKEKYEMIQQLEQEKNTPPVEVEQPTETEPQEEVERPEKEKKKRIVEVEKIEEVEESDSETESEEEEIVIKKVIKQIPRQKKHQQQKNYTN